MYTSAGKEIKAWAAVKKLTGKFGRLSNSWHVSVSGFGTWLSFRAVRLTLFQLARLVDLTRHLIEDNAIKVGGGRPMSRDIDYLFVAWLN